MDERLQVTDSPREVSAEVAAETPLVSIAWRTLRAEYQARAEECRRAEAEASSVANALASIAEEMHRLRRAARGFSPVIESAGKTAEERQFLVILDRVVQVLASQGIEIVAPEGEQFTSELMELIESVAQQPHPGVSAPRITEIIAPAITHHQAILRMGKAVIAVPVPNSDPAHQGERPVGLE